MESLVYAQYPVHLVADIADFLSRVSYNYAYCYIAIASKSGSVIQLRYMPTETCTALIIYEHIVTFDHDVLAIWRYGMTGVNVILLFNRYLLLLTAITEIIETFNLSSDPVSRVMQ